MGQLANLFGNLPLILGVALFIGIVVLVRLLLSPNSLERRRTLSDRRRGRPMPQVPFYDSNRILVTEDRRTLGDRRKHAFMISTTQRRA